MQEKYKPSGIIRNKLSDLNRLKGKGKKSGPAKMNRFSKAALKKACLENEQAEQVSMRSSLMTESTRPSQIEMAVLDSPSWMEQYKECCSLLENVEVMEKELLKESSKKMTSVNEKKHDLIIQSLIGEATQKLNQCERLLKTMEHVNNLELNHSNIQIFTHMLISMATNIRSKAKNIRNIQQAQLHRETQLKKYTKSIFDQDQNTTQVSQADNWLMEEEFEDMESQMVKERTTEITNIIKSINSLNTIYKQLQNLVIHQGSLLDRIDENISTAEHNVKEGNKHLESANKKQESKCANKVMCILIGCIFAFFLVFIAKHS